MTAKTLVCRRPYSDARGVLDDALSLVEGDYAILGPKVWDAADFGAATKRQRLFVVGFHKKVGTSLRAEDVEALKRPPATVRAAISDLQDATPLRVENGYDLWRISRRGRPFAYASRLRSPDGRFSGHQLTKHTPEVVQRFSKVAPGKVDAVGRHPRLEWDGHCPTLRAGTGADRGSYQSVRPIHPDLPRVITVREAARLQGFPDGHRFHPTVWHSFRMIGNSVCPLMAEAIFTAIGKRLSSSQAALATAAE